MRKYNQDTGFGPMFSVMTAMVSPAHQAITRQPLYERVEPLKFYPNFKALALMIVDLIWRWNRRHTERRALMSLDDRMLRDIGVERALVLDEWSKPFWQK